MKYLGNDAEWTHAGVEIRKCENTYSYISLNNEGERKQTDLYF